MTETLKTDSLTGIVLKLEYDEARSDLDPTDPGNDEAQNDVRFVVLHRRYQNPAERFGLTDSEAVHAFMEENNGPDAEWVWWPLWLYDHSGTAYRVAKGNPFSGFDPGGWDSGQVGILALKRATWGSTGTDQELWEIADSIADTYTAWANGEVYSYVIEDADGEELDSCGGFIGRECAEEEGEAAFESEVARALEALDEKRGMAALKLKTYRNAARVAVTDLRQLRAIKPQLVKDGLSQPLADRIEAALVRVLCGLREDQHEQWAIIAA